ncbi:uncharacterized protein [Blastocystis hominis]|uniref:Uncharacterized protein n=1 Tax=Blastocystis hominis TaxID=12968 RepID=D8M6S6_BLAHO|nr:uncharacterized protein [Blastocystis hominis]CBK23494.2 unnamed protein product [Blastocystis hominis]|eukprot:XP_012897542.1 uncharacterized protein [Blastocystis hominis]
MIDPATSLDGETVEGYSMRRWGSTDWINGLRESGKKDRITFNNWKFWPNSFNAHRVMMYARSIHFKDVHNLALTIYNALRH